MQKERLLDGGHRVTNTALMGSLGPREARDIAGPEDRVGEPERPASECVRVRRWGGEGRGERGHLQGL